MAHLPSIVANLAAMKAQGVGRVCCVSVNDAFVMDKWGKASGAEVCLLSHAFLSHFSPIPLILLPSSSHPSAAFLSRFSHTSLVCAHQGITMLGDAVGKFTTACGLGLDCGDFMGQRSAFCCIFRSFY